MKKFDVLAIHPTWNREACFRSVHADRLVTNEHGETYFRFNKFYPAVEVIAAEEISQAKLDAEAAYFKRYGTASE